MRRTACRIALLWVGLWVAFPGAVAPGAAAAAEAGERDGVLRTISGQEARGRVTWNPSGFLVTPATGEAIRCSLAELASLKLDPAESGAGEGANSGDDRPGPGAAGGAATGAGRAVGALPPKAGWVGVQVGGGEEGSFREDADGILVTGGGAGLIGNADSFYFAQQRMEASGQLVARLESFQANHNEAMAGIALRDNLGESSAYAFVGFRGGSGLCFQYRQIASGMTMRTTNVNLGMPVWLRLVRLGGSVVADVSADGRQWQNMARGNVNLGQSVRAGMVLATGIPQASGTARFRDPVVGARGIGYAPGSGYPRVVLRGGSVLIGPVERADESVIRLGGELSGNLVSALNLARIEYVPLTPDLRERAEADRRGVLLVDGDFLDGTLRSIATNSVTVSSLLYGFKAFAAGSEAAWVQSGPVEAEEGAYLIALRNGSELRARQVELGANTLRAESPLLGSILVPGDLVREIRLTGRP
ncbi:MAG: hypothetical protein AB7O66_02995 [Limisphaerales bacterium]